MWIDNKISILAIESIVMLVYIQRILNAGQLLYSLLLHWHVTCSVGMLQIHLIELCLILQMMYGSAFLVSS